MSNYSKGITIENSYTPGEESQPQQQQQRSYTGGRGGRGGKFSNRGGRGGNSRPGGPRRLDTSGVEFKTENVEKLFGQFNKDDDAQLEAVRENEDSELHPSMEWDDMGLSPKIIQTFYDQGWDSPSRIQCQVIPELSKGNSVIGQAPTGSGKTIAFLTGTLSVIDPNVKQPQAVVLANSRELVLQNAHVFRILNKYTEFVYGDAIPTEDQSQQQQPQQTGEEKDEELPKLEDPPIPTTKECQVIFGTPASVLYEIKNNKWSPEQIKLLIVDEADEIITQPSHYRGLSNLIKLLNPIGSKFGFFSATFPAHVITKIGEMTNHQPISQYRLKRNQIPVKTIHHFFVRCNNEQESFNLILHLYQNTPQSQTIIFSNAKASIGKIKTLLTTNGFSTAELMGGMKTEDRDMNMQRFRAGDIKVLITTNVLSRGIDIPECHMVVNLSVPQVYRTHGSYVDIDSYVHRSGRAARFGRKGVCLTIIKSPKELEDLKIIAAELKIELKELPLNDFTALNANTNAN